MKRKFLIVGSLAFMQLIASAQRRDSVVEKISKNEVELVYNHYIQDGNHSAVTGGTGTEQLTVYGPSLRYKRVFGKNAAGFTVGTDVISSASVDNIDFVSSASRVDARSYLDGTYQRTRGDWSVVLGAGTSIESDYFSLNGKLGILKEDKEKLADYSMMLQVYRDDLRWGRLNADEGYRPVKLIYPEELRYREWYDRYKRNSYTLKAAFNVAVNSRNRLGVSGEMAYQEGLLATPFHRVYFTDDSLAVEQLPSERWKGGIAFRWNTFPTGRWVLKNSVNIYRDSWQITTASIENETVLKLNRKLSLLPGARWYIQRGTPYFAKNAQHAPDAVFHTSDFDLSSLQSLNAGIGLRYTPYAPIWRQWMFSSLLFKYSYYHRSDGLSAHIFTMSFGFE